QPRASRRTSAKPTITHHEPRRLAGAGGGGTACSSACAVRVSVTILPWNAARRLRQFHRIDEEVEGLRSDPGAVLTQPDQVEPMAHAREASFSGERVEAPI